MRVPYKEAPVDGVYAVHHVRVLVPAPQLGLDLPVQHLHYRTLQGGRQNHYKETFYLMMHSAHLWLYSIRTYGKGPLRQQKEKSTAVTSFQLAVTDIYMDSIYHGLYYTSLGHGLEQEIAQWIYHEGSIVSLLVYFLSVFEVFRSFS